ncbi:sigma-70 family RNA polymerase sigma factor [Kribbella sp. NPDC051770]|uniref:sigma-70 family RNA polymerase sigma factor n=1 Tax=Kribbella sp. NPDC051770 TaxID=3155413 RepID=UPI00343B0136
MTIQLIDRPIDRPSTAPVQELRAEDGLSAFVSARPRLLRIASRVLSSQTDAEDVVQEIWLRWQRTDRSVVADPHAFLVTMTVRLAINVAQSARRRRETPVGEWYQDQIGCTDDDPATEAELAEEVERAVLTLLGSLPPRERAAYVLREAFDYPYARISEILHTGAANTRQLVSRARTHLSADRDNPVCPAAHHQLLQAFLKAARAGDLTDLEALLIADLPAELRAG